MHCYVSNGSGTTLDGPIVVERLCSLLIFLLCSSSLADGGVRGCESDSGLYYVVEDDVPTFSGSEEFALSRNRRRDLINLRYVAALSDP